MNKTTALSRGNLLDTWSGHDWTEGIQLETLEDLDELVVHTQNSVYELTVISAFAGEILVRGGSFFPSFTPARLAGSSLGGSFLKMLGIYVGFRMEIHDDQRTIITSRVKTIALRDSTRA